jgi:exopolyphosphatase/guanosine-5'-triphosphate,3'-diphosphate pyrophosphatase
LLDVGGGSAQFILGHGQTTDFRHSFPLGTVRLLETLPHGDPPRAGELAAFRAWLADFFQKEVEPKLAPAMSQETKYSSHQEPIKIVGTGGTATILGCMEAGLRTFDRERLEAVRLGRKRLSEQVERLWRLALAERQEIVGLPKNRADVILPGAAIYEAVLSRFGFPELRISTRGLRFAAVMQTK